ncbi:iron chelate uptake ABC transporter family permease subunit [Glutamicibacter sp. JL.03c]|uniref:FecCD family ABC transporter permease n=1 Tax=Glutamicibacter sp. JL.03c TaxID=2984842 RepID=UPI0021F7829D|nr:iron chelate uptake ABC transporter family permease subunit [Glutamicibacter sp. JL.03c]UYQ77766.1 iron chelate uptake ABC transporter family permease subunit [Glutamicibacter sp. JL.03c]
MGTTSLLLALGVSLFVGTSLIGPAEVWRILIGQETGYNAEVIWKLRIPRTLIGFTVGAALALAGEIIQAVTRNPLAEPGILGVNSGAAVAVVLSIGVLGISSPRVYLWFALGGAGLAAIAVSLLGGVLNRSSSTARLLLAGSAISAALSAGVSAFALADRSTYEQFRFWVIGSLNVPTLEILGQTGPFLLLGSVLAFALCRSMDALALGEDMSRGLGSRTGWVRTGALLSVTLLCGAATATCGPIAFVGLATPHIARALLGATHARTLPFQVILGPVLLLTADIIGRVIAAPAEVQTGIITAFIGAPAFLIILSKRRVVAP